MCARVEPCETTGKCFYLQFSVFQEFLIDGRDLKFSAGRRFDMGRNVYHLIWIKV